MKLPKAFIIMLCIAGLLSSCEVVKEAYDNPKSIPVLIAILPLYVIYQGIFGVAAFNDAITLHTEDFVKEAGECLTPYDATMQNITDSVFVISDPVRCVDKDSSIHFTDNNVYYLGKDAILKEDSFSLKVINGTAYQCQPVGSQTSHQFSCKINREYIIEQNRKNYPASFRLKDMQHTPAWHRDASFPWLELYSYKKECKQPLIKLPASTQEEILFGMFDDSAYPVSSGRACNFLLIRKIPRAAVIGY